MLKLKQKASLSHRRHRRLDRLENEQQGRIVVVILKQDDFT